MTGNVLSLCIQQITPPSPTELKQSASVNQRKEDHKEHYLVLI